MKAILLGLVLVSLCGCSDFAQGFADGYNRAQALPACQPAYYEPWVAPYTPPPTYQAEPIHTGIITQMGQPPAIYSVGPTGGVITQMDHAPIFISP